MEIIEPKGLKKIAAGQMAGCVCSSGSSDANMGAGWCVGSCDYGVRNGRANLGLATFA